MRGGGVGDLICKLAIETPVGLTKKQKALLQELTESLSSNTKHSPRAKTWLDGVKSFFDEIM